MVPVLALIVVGVAVVVLGWGVFTAATRRPISWAQLGAVGLLELLVLAQSVVAGVRLAAGHQVAETATTVGYLIGIVVLLPLAAVWALSDRSRWAGVVLAVAAFAVGAMVLRLLALWSAHA